MLDRKGYKAPVFCRQSFATGARRFQAGEVYETGGDDPATRATAQLVAANGEFFTSDIPAKVGPVVALDGV